MTEHGICAKCRKSVGCSYADDRITGCKKFVLEPELELTNEEWRKTCSAEEFAEWLEEVCFWEQCNDGESMSGRYEDHDAKYWKGWLKQPHTFK